MEEGLEGEKGFYINLFIEYLLSTHSVLDTGLIIDIGDTKLKQSAPTSLKDLTALRVRQSYKQIYPL